MRRVIYSYIQRDTRSTFIGNAWNKVHIGEMRGETKQEKRKYQKGYPIATTKAKSFLKL